MVQLMHVLHDITVPLAAPAGYGTLSSWLNAVAVLELLMLSRLFSLGQAFYCGLRAGAGAGAGAGRSWTWD